MNTITLTPERLAQLEEYARARGEDPAAVVDAALATYIEMDRNDFESAVEGIRRGGEDMKAGRTRPAGELLASLRRRYDLPG